MMRMRLRQLTRMLMIQRVLVKHGLDEIVWRTHLFRPLAWLGRLLAFGRRRKPLGVRLREALEELGPIFVKFGQALSVRPDLLPLEVAAELAKLQDQVPPFAGEQAAAALHAAFGRPVEQVFAEFDARAARGGVDRAGARRAAAGRAGRRREGLAAERRGADPARRRGAVRDRDSSRAVLGRRAPAAPVEIVSEFERTLAVELDLMREAANAAQLKRNFAGSELLYVPEIYWDYCRTNVLTIERIFGIQVDESRRCAPPAPTSSGWPRTASRSSSRSVPPQLLSRRHAPRQHLRRRDGPARPKYVAVDFGIVGTLDERDQHYLAENFLAFFRRDYRRVATLHVDSAWVPPGTRVDELEAAVRAVCEPIFNKPLKDISFGLVLLRLFQTARQFNMEIQPQLVLLQKTLLAIEGWAGSSTRSSISGRRRSPSSSSGCASVTIRARGSSSSSKRGRRSATISRYCRSCCTARCGAWTPTTPPPAAASARPSSSGAAPHGAARAARHRRGAVDRGCAVERARRARVARLGRCRARPCGARAGAASLDRMRAVTT